MLDIVWKDMAPTVAVVGIGLIGLRQYPKFTKAQRVTFQIGVVGFILGLSLFVVTGLVSRKDTKANV
ncbi:hypothetical protein N7504_004345 [Penicillium tannophilum]|nr:hypothetical protein N7504_004345 [Penicillium tannophilum]